MKNVTILFIIDTSGSMAGQTTSAVSSAIYESLDAIRKIDTTVKVGFCWFNEEMNWLNSLKSAEEAELVEAGASKPQQGQDGFFRLTLYECLYKKLGDVLRILNDQIRGTELYLFLLSDGKPVDVGDYSGSMKNCISIMDGFQAHRFAVRTGQNGANGEEALLEFAGTSETVIDLERMADTFSMLAMSLAST